MKTISLLFACSALSSFVFFSGCGLDSSGDKASYPAGSSGTPSGSSNSSSSGGGAAPADCTAGESFACYAGPTGTEGVGVCIAGTQLCGSDGKPSGECMDQVLPAPADDCVSGIDANCDGTKPSACTGDSLWGIQFGSTNSDRGFNVDTDSENNVVMAGFMGYDADIFGTVYETKGGEDIVILKLSSAGDLLWAKTFGGTYIDRAYDISVDSTNHIWVVGAFSNIVDFGFGPFISAGASDIFLLKLSPEGEPLMARRFGGPNEDYGFAVSAGSDRVAITGSFYSQGINFDSSAPSFSAKGEDVFVASFTLDGQYVWSKAFGDGSPQTAWDIDVNAQGDVFVAGEMYGKVDIGGGELTANGRDAFVFSLDRDGQHRYSGAFGGSNDQVAWALTADDEGHAYAVGSFYSTMELDKPLNAPGGWDAFITRLDTGGKPEWSFSFESSTLEKVIYNIDLDRFGNILFAGAYYGKGTWEGMDRETSSRDIMVGKLSPAGKPVWLKLFGDNGNEQKGWGITSDSEGFVYAAGAFDFSATFVNGTELKSEGAADGFVVKLNP